MQAHQENNNVVNNRRKGPRWTVYNFLRATAVLCKTTDLNALRQGKREPSWTGMLVDISERGAQMIMPEECLNEFQSEQQAGVCIRTSLEDTDFEVLAVIKSIEKIDGKKAARINAQFVGVEKNFQTKVRMRELFEYISKLLAVEAT
jgi:hypothetical protein